MALAGRMDEISNHAIGLLNEAKLQSDTSAKVDKLKQLKELILYKEPWLLPEFIPHLMELQSEPGSPVRKYLAEVIEEIGFKYTEQLPLMVPVLLVLLNDSVPAVARRAITSGANLFRNTLEQVALMGIYSGQVDKHIEDAWSWMTRFKDAVYPVAYQHANDGVRIHAVKFIETTIMLFTPDPSGSPHPPPPLQQNDGTSKGFNVEWIASKHPLLDAVAMGQEASKNLGLLLNQLRPPDISSLPCPVAIVLVNSLTAIAKKRPSMFGRILPALLSLGPTCEAIKGQVASLIHALKNALLSLLKCTHPGATPWRERLVEMLRKMNAGDAAEMTISQMFRNVDKDSGHMNRNLKDEKMVDGTKKRAMSQENGTGAWDDSSGKKFRATLTGPVLMTSSHQQVSSEMEDINNSTVDTGIGSTPDNGLSPFQHLIGMIGALVAQGDRASASIDLLIATLPPDTLADVVILNMQNLPMTEPLPSEDQSLMDGLPSLSPGRSQQVNSISLMATLPVQPNSVADAATASDTRRDPRRDPRRMDPRFSVGLASPKQEDTILAVNSAASELDLKVGTESVGHPIAVKMEINSPTNSSRDPRASLQARSIPIPGDTMPVHVKCEPMEEVSMSTSAPVLPPAMSPGETTPQTEVLSPVSPVKTELEVEPHLVAITQPSLKEAPNLSAPNIVGLPSGGGSMMIPVLPLNDEQQSALIKAALLRVLEGYKGITSAGGGELRIALLARLTAHSFAGAESLDIIQKHILGDYGNHMGHELALHVLYELYVEQIEDPGSETSFEVYNNFLLSLAEGLRDSLPPTDRALSKLLAEVPILPIEALKLLERLCNPINDAKDLSSERITQGLLALWNLILHRPPVRETCLKMTLQCAVHELEDVRAKAIRLVANKLYPLPCISKSIEDFACNMLLAAMSTAASTDRATDSMDLISTSQTDSMDKAGQGDTELQVKHKLGVTSLLSEASVDDDAQKGRNRNTSVSEAQRCMSLYFALCTKKHALLQQLFRAYGSAPKPVKQAMRKDFPLLIRTVGSSSPELLDIISDPPGGSEQLVLLALERLTDASTPSPELISTVKKLYETKLKDAMFLIPVLSSLSKDEVLPIFPRLVDLPPETFQVALARILQGSAHTGPALTPAEVLIALHGIDHQRDAVPLKKVTDACSACLQQRTVFTHQVLAKVLNQLVEQTPLPLLFMRTVIQAVGAFPSLVNFVMDILSRLVNKQIWKFPQLWVGFLKCAHQTVPQSFHVLLQLPTAQLENALSKFPGLKSQLSAHASQPTIRTTVPRSSLILLGLAQDEVSTDSVLPNTQPIQDSISSGRAQSDAQPSESANVSS